MNWPLSFLIAAITGVIGLIAAGLITIAYQDWYHVSIRDAGAGFAVIIIALLGGVAAFIFGLIVARFVGPGFGKALGCSAGIVLGIAGLLALRFYLGADFPPTIGGERLMLEFEIQLPVGHARPSGEMQFGIRTSAKRTRFAAEAGEMKWSEARLENDRWILPAEVSLFTSRGHLTMNATVGGADIGEFAVPLPRRPGKADEQWSGWFPQPPPGEPPWPESKSSFRFRVRRIPPPPPPPTAAEYEAQAEAEAQAKFDSIPADSPVTAWLEYTELHIPEKRRNAAVQRILGKPEFVTELNTLMLTDGPYDEAARAAAAALYFIGRMEKPGADLNPGVATAGRDIMARIRKFNASTPEQDPGYLGAADVSIRFSAWMSATRTLREKAGGDFVPELREILELSRLRTDSRVMHGDVCRVASYYLKLWANIEPLPGDPPPR